MSLDYDPHGVLSQARQQYQPRSAVLTDPTPTDVFDQFTPAGGDGGHGGGDDGGDDQPAEAPKPKKRRRSIASTMIGMLLALCSIAALGVGGSMIWDATQEQEAPMPEHEFSADDPDTYEGVTIDDYIEQLALESQTNDTVFDHMVTPDMAIHGDQADRTGISHIDADYEGAGVWIPSLDIESPMISTDHNGTELILPEPPTSTWYQQTAPVGADQGNTMIASHVNWGHGDDAPFSQLHKIDKGAPIFVRDFEGNDVPYVVTDIQVYDQQALPDELFSLEGDHKLRLLTCSGPTIERGNELYFMYNLVVTAEPYEAGIGA